MQQNKIKYEKYDYYLQETGETGEGGSTGDLIKVGLRDDYEQFDFEWPMIVREAEEELEDVEIDINSLMPFSAFPLERLRQFLAQDGETFISQEAISKTQFGPVRTRRRKPRSSYDIHFRSFSQTSMIPSLSSFFSVPM